MVTKYTTGQAVLIPATIKTAEEINGQILYHVDADIWEGIPESAIMVNKDAEAANAMEAFRRQLLDRSNEPWR